MLKFNLRHWAKHTLVRSRIRRRFHASLEKPLVLVHQMGKVGSSSVTATIRASFLEIQVEQTHTLHPDHLAYAIQRERDSGQVYLPEHLLVSRQILDKGIPFTKMITLTREPIGRSVSFFYEDLKKQSPEALLMDKQIATAKVNEDLLSVLRGSNGTSNPGIWFNREIESLLGIDVFASPFYTDRGYSIYSNGQVDVLLLRMEDLDRCLVPALAEFFNVKPGKINVKASNIGSSKWYNDAMRETKASLELPTDVLERVLSTSYVQHFYSDYIDRLRSKWGAE